ncbi:MAG: hypothetical protein RIC35_00210 [Marinoscillum sp.]
MKVKYQRYAYLALILVFLGVIVTCIYYFLGGFEPIEVYRLKSINRTIAGKQFVSHYTDEAPIEFGARCRKMVEEGDIEGTLSIITYKSDTLPETHIAQFIGITLHNEMSEIPQDFEIREIETGPRYAVFMSMHVLVQPRPHKVEAMLYAAAQENGEELQGLFFQLRYPDNSLSVEGWVKP